MHQYHVQPLLGNSQALYGASDRGPISGDTCLEILELLNLVKSEIDEKSVDGLEKDEL